MSFLDINTDDAIEPKAVAGDEEYEVRLVSLEQSVNKKGNPYLLARLDIPSEPASKDLTHYMALPHGAMSEKELNNCKWNLKTFFEAFGMDTSGQIDLGQGVGNTTWAILGAKEDGTYGEQNNVKRFVRSK